MPKVGTYAYPFYDIDFVLIRLKRVYEVLKIDQIKRSVVAETLGMTESGGAFTNIISSLKRYGLVETGKKNVVITELGKMAMYGNDIQRKDAIGDAVSKIDLFTGIYKQFGPEVNEEQIIAFLRQKANVDIIKARNEAPKLTKIYIKMQKYLRSVEAPEQAPRLESKGIDRREIITPPEDLRSQPLKIQYGDVYIQLPRNDLKALAMAKKAIEFMENVVKNEKATE